jgi:hypothetical protein
MLNKKNIAIIVGISLFGVFAILIALAVVRSDNPDVPQAEGVKPASVVNAVYGSIRLPEAISQFQVEGANGLVTIGTGKPTGRLPAGQYHIRYWKIERKDDQGNKWALNGRYYGKDKPFEIKDGDETTLDVGEPIIATVDARNVGSSYSFNQVIKGRHNEIVELTRNGSRPQAPKLRIKNKDGSYDRTFDFQYG